MIVILGLGSSVGAMNETSRFIRPLLEFLFPSASAESLTFIHGIIRKSAHFVEYGILEVLAARAFRTLLDRLIPTLSFALLLAAAVALLDEFQQSFNPVRTSSPYDVLIDLAGAVSAAAVFFLLSRRRRNVNSAKTSEP